MLMNANNHKYEQYSRASYQVLTKKGWASFSPPGRPPLLLSRRTQTMEAIPMNVGHSTIPRMRVPALLKGKMIDLDLASLEGQWGILCCLPRLEFCDAVFLNQFRRTVKKQGAVLLGMQQPAHPFIASHLPTTKILSIPLLPDSAHRLGRALGLWSEPRLNQCQTFIFDPEGVIMDRLIHSFNWHCMTLLLSMLKQCQNFSPQPARERIDNPVPANFMFAGQGLWTKATFDIH